MVRSVPRGPERPGFDSNSYLSLSLLRNKVVAEKEKTFLVLLSVDALKWKKNLACEDVGEFFKIRLS